MQVKIKRIAENLRNAAFCGGERRNISRSERMISSAFGAFMLYHGIKDLFHKPANGVWELILGAGLIYRGTSGYCAVKESLEDAGTKTPDQGVIIETYGTARR